MKIIREAGVAAFRMDMRKSVSPSVVARYPKVSWSEIVSHMGDNPGGVGGLTTVLSFVMAFVTAILKTGLPF